MKFVVNPYHNKEITDELTREIFSKHMVVVDSSSDPEMFKYVIGVNTARLKHPTNPYRREAEQQWFVRFNKSLSQNNDKIRFVLLENLAAAWSFLSSKPACIEAIIIPNESILLLCTKIRADRVALLSKAFKTVIITEAHNTAQLESINAECTVTIHHAFWSSISFYERVLYLQNLRHVVTLYYQDTISRQSTLRTALIRDAITKEQIELLSTDTQRLMLTETTYEQHKQSLPDYICILWLIGRTPILNRYVIRANGFREELLKTVPNNHTTIHCESMPNDLQILNTLPEHITRVWLPEQPESLEGIRNGLEIHCHTNPPSRGHTPDNVSVLLSFSSQGNEAKRMKVAAEPIEVEEETQARPRSHSLSSH